MPEHVKAERLAELQQELAKQQSEFNAKFLGATVPVLFDRPGKQEGQLSGRSPWLHAVHADGVEGFRDQIVDVVISSAGPHGLTGMALEAA